MCIVSTLKKNFVCVHLHCSGLMKCTHLCSDTLHQQNIYKCINNNNIDRWVDRTDNQRKCYREIGTQEWEKIISMRRQKIRKLKEWGEIPVQVYKGSQKLENQNTKPTCGKKRHGGWGLEDILGYCSGFQCQSQKSRLPKEVVIRPTQSWIHNPATATPCFSACCK